MEPRTRHAWVVQLFACLVLGVTMATDYGLGAWKSSPPDWAYAVLAALSFGVSPQVLRRLLITALTKRISGDTEK
jgi:hypothetical protein